jgi:hypothetical protein
LACPSRTWIRPDIDVLLEHVHAPPYFGWAHHQASPASLIEVLSRLVSARGAPAQQQRPRVRVQGTPVVDRRARHRDGIDRARQALGEWRATPYASSSSRSHRGRLLSSLIVRVSRIASTANSAMSACTSNGFVRAPRRKFIEALRRHYNEMRSAFESRPSHAEQVRGSTGQRSDP